VCTIAMDLSQRLMHIRRGNNPDNPFHQFPVMQKDTALSM
jgi:isopenicillin-N N-acyltransferase-like protein